MQRIWQPEAMDSSRRLAAGSQQFEQWLVEGWMTDGRAEPIEEAVADMIMSIAGRGDQALIEFTSRFDGWSPTAADDLHIGAQQIERAAAGLDADDRAALAAAAERIERYHARQRIEKVDYTDELGNRIGCRWRPLDSVAVYVPGGTAAYPSSLLMGALPAVIAGVKKVVFVTPASGADNLDPWIAYAAQLAGLKEGFCIGGAQAVAALALGTATIARVEKIVGPGNAYVTEAKRQLVGRVGIDLLAGPSELVVIGDGSAPAEWTAADLAAQAEHGPDSKVALISTSRAELDEVAGLLEGLLESAGERVRQLSASLANATLIEARDIKQARQAANRIAPEHLQLSIADAQEEMEREWICGCLCAGSQSPVVLSDYCAGNNHILPTAGRARFSSGLSVRDFMRATSVFAASSAGAAQLSSIAARIAQGEKLPAHARAAVLRGREG